MVSKEKDLMEWFSEILKNAKLYDYGNYPIKGCGSWLPNGFLLRNKVTSILRGLLNETGHKEVLLPLLITREMLEKEAKHIAGFIGQVYWVTKGGEDKLEMELALRPTSETAMAVIFKNFLLSYRDLPLKVYQIVSIFRYETKTTHPMIRVREVNTFKEAFTFSATKEESLEMVKEAYDIYCRFFDKLGIPYITVERPSWDRFPGAEISIAFDTILPDGKSLQIGSIHYLAQNFSKVFDGKFMRRDGSYDYYHMNSYGISERSIAALLIHFGDDIGAIIPPNLAPVQIVIVPIIYESLKNEILDYSKKVHEIIQLAGYKAILDDREDKTPGEKFYEWERLGVPLRIEIGPREIKEQKLFFAERTGNKKHIPLNELFKQIKISFSNIEIQLKNKARNDMFNKIISVDKLASIDEILRNKKVAKFGICEKEECGKTIDKMLTGASFLGYDFMLKSIGNCIVCNSKTERIGYVAKTY